MFVKPRIYMADFETTVSGDYGQDETEVWAAALVEVKNEFYKDVDGEVYIDNSIESFFARLFYLTGKGHSICYFHNLKFDGSFIIDYLLKKGYTLATNDWDGKWREDKYMSKGSFKCVISDMGQWYTITVKSKIGTRVTFRDSLKLLPFSVDQIGKSFDTLHKKLKMDYIGNMHASGIITEAQRKYITNDVLVVKEALEIFFEDGLDKLTIGACCKDQYRKSIMSADYEKFYPKMTDIKLDDAFGATTAEAYVRKAYKGGWCYLRPDRANIIYKKGCTADVNSLYPSEMLDNPYPVGKPTFWQGNFIPEEALQENRLFIVRVKTRFELKKDKLPTIQIKGSPYYRGKEWLTSSDVTFNGKKYSRLKKPDGSVVDLRPTLTLTEVDYKLLQEHYDLTDFEILDGCYFWKMDGKLLFGDYINMWAEVKKTSKGARRQEAKLFLNNLYGKFAAKINATTKAPYIEDGKVKFFQIADEDPRKEWYIPVGVFVTSYARNFTIRAAQANYKNFVYADTDSIHCICDPSELKGITVHPTNFSCWCLEATWDQAIFVRQKTYIEHVVEEELKPCTPYYNIKCAGMNKRPKELLAASLEGRSIDTTDPDEIEFLKTKRTLADFKVGLAVPGKLMTRRVKGGIVLVSTFFHIS